MKVLSFGEMMLRLKTPGNERILQTQSYEATYGGAEANVAVSLALLGDEVSYLSKFPNNPLGQAAKSTLQKYGVDTSKILTGGDRLGIYFFEKGTSVRSTNVVYDRAYSAFSQVAQTEFDWPTIFKDVDYFYFSGITPAISPDLEQAALAACEYCKQQGIPVVCDLNYRAKMWSPEQAQKVISKIMEYVTICIAHDEDFEATLGIQAFDGDSSRGIEQKESFKAAMKQVQADYPNCKMVASILRNIYSVEASQWTALLLTDETFYETATYDMHVMEGVAAGDAFGAGLLHGLLHDYSSEKLVKFALAASVLKLTITGDLNLVSEAEINQVMESNSGARLAR
ncbi:sugar kinase [Enterococcus dongliensis]|uniref:Sugar kinase n=1 Tax=Enterococcus dongliensis TaxID=2559925 RepID=A0AAW8TN14_9ENTE|nr:sugar kinase [Enterococcus dongliensis]MDT2596200.1 sugar kinase [Enterococcus dongliensis]MDT2603921.1 sugar kinase [Enterococcus dongliensis]MDT2634183.1 sugar kinase [Enterococcus dongliensis]MDT2637113.1 sugar kinase [Enterococcus dongliensis]MDT2642474.1 sugar kinase [Enterococcus dongliensis]